MTVRTLTRRQVQILDLTACGDTNPEIAEKLRLGEQTVKTHLRRAGVALGARNRVHAAVLAYAAGVIQGPEPVDVVVGKR